MFDLASRYYAVFGNAQCGLLLYLIEKYVNAAEIQTTRIERARNEIRQLFASFKASPESLHSKRNPGRTLWGDAHFYFTCLGQIDRLLDALCKEIKNEDLRTIHTKFRRELKPEFRNDLEHLEDRVFGLKKKGRKKVRIGNIQDFINFIGGGVSFNRKVYPMGREPLKKLKGFYKEIIATIRRDYGLKNRWFVLHELQDQKLRAIKRTLRRHQELFLRQSES